MEIVKKNRDLSEKSRIEEGKTVRRGLNTGGKGVPGWASPQEFGAQVKAGCEKKRT